MSRANEGSSSTRDHQPSRGYSNSMDHVSSLMTEKSYTSFKWKLNEFSFLEEYLIASLDSPYFLITNTQKQCQLSIQKRNETIRLSVKIPGEIPGEILQIDLSIIDENNTKIKKSRSFVFRFRDEMSSPIYENLMQIGAKEILSKKKYLINDTLTFLCEILLVSVAHVSKADAHSSNLAHFYKNVCHTFEECYSTKAFSDIDLFVNGKQFRAHKLILATASPVFKAMFQTDMLETEKNSVRITDIDADLFKKFLEYLYVGKVENLDEIAADLLIVAGKYQVSGLMDLCENAIIKNIDISNAIKWLFMADQHNFKKLKDVVLQFVRSNIQSLSEANHFKELCACSDLFAEVLSGSK